MRYLSLAEALVIAEAVTGIDCAVLAKSAGIGLFHPAYTPLKQASAGKSSIPTLLRRRRY